MSRVISSIVCVLVLQSLAGAAYAEESIAYRLRDWKQMHFEDSTKAAQHLDAVSKLGCDAKKDSHGGHTDVVYRSPQWQHLEVANDQLAHQWEAWLKGAGFETLHGHSAGHAGHDHAGHSHAGHDHGPGEVEEVSYRLAKWTTIRGENDAKTHELLALMRGLGCDVQTSGRGGSADVQIRCTQWKHVEFPSHAAAQQWEDWLRKSGFEVQHNH